MLSQGIARSSEAQAYLNGLKSSPTENDPAIAFGWNDDAVEQFVREANRRVGRRIPQAAFITTAPGQMTAGSLKRDIITCLAQVAGGSSGNVLLAPNTLAQAFNIHTVLTHIERDPWMQKVTLEGVPEGIFLATLYQITDRSIASGLPTGRAAPPAGFRQLFQ